MCSQLTRIIHAAESLRVGVWAVALRSLKRLTPPLTHVQLPVCVSISAKSIQSIDLVYFPQNAFSINIFRELPSFNIHTQQLNFLLLHRFNYMTLNWLECQSLNNCICLNKKCILYSVNWFCVYLSFRSGNSTSTSCHQNGTTEFNGCLESELPQIIFILMATMRIFE